SSISELAATASSSLSSIPYPFELELQLGRYLVADAAVGLTTVLAEKATAAGTWRICDLGSNVLIPLPDIAYAPLPSSQSSGEEWGMYHITDGTGTPVALCRDAVLPV